MPTTILNLATRRTLDFSGLAIGGTLSLGLGRAIDLGLAKRAELVVRVHSHGLQDTNRIEVLGEQVSLSSEQPETDFVGASVGTISLHSLIPTTPTAQIVELSEKPLGHMIRVRVNAVRSASTPIWATLSVDLVLRDDR